ncbi:2-polyprenylphenol hydroxylase-like oxidoreductase [secondary endosymbiont of Heteropsylla cubana]|uniref:NAD(P)H-flavin reductase n=1 Tax=secondary endosymbiont of Heteropsylla cubana TaxID=134287 RepID=J3VTZ8_9ENTR|nr:NAD(P)H-flavin reductase [secondary endosymbiont of Heteropsylla cubana]AFP85546.1 2-polyprenylphenol hydroxylase-like oxidoreductase [secondary endosymbiont of Heteropsylla cubana]
MIRLTCKVLSVDAITKTVYRIRLVRAPTYNFRAGQYLMVVMDHNDIRPFSMASTPLEQTFIELHIDASSLNLYARKLVEAVIKTQEITIERPRGSAFLRDDTERPILLIAGGTGFSYIRSILLTVLSLQPTRKVMIYWGGKKREHLYKLDELEVLALQYSKLSVVPVVEQCDDKQWKGRYGTVIMAVIQDYNYLKPYDIYIGGNFNMARVAQTLLCSECRAVVERIFSDAFSLERNFYFN